MNYFLICTHTTRLFHLPVTLELSSKVCKCSNSASEKRVLLIVVSLTTHFPHGLCCHHNHWQQKTRSQALSLNESPYSNPECHSSRGHNPVHPPQTTYHLVRTLQKPITNSLKVKVQHLCRYIHTYIHTYVHTYIRTYFQH